VRDERGDQSDRRGHVHVEPDFEDRAQAQMAAQLGDLAMLLAEQGAEALHRVGGNLARQRAQAMFGLGGGVVERAGAQPRAQPAAERIFFQRGLDQRGGAGAERQAAE
jgi:hypothetical protein